ncbi:hypothetical protein SCUP515_09202 [Seiridium cupressi]
MSTDLDNHDNPREESTIILFFEPVQTAATVPLSYHTSEANSRYKSCAASCVVARALRQGHPGPILIHVGCFLVHHCQTSDETSITTSQEHLRMRSQKSQYLPAVRGTARDDNFSKEEFCAASYELLPLLRWEGTSRPTRTSNFVAPADDEDLSKDARNIHTDLSLQVVNGNAVCASAIYAQGSLSHGSNYEDIAKDDHPTCHID